MTITRRQMLSQSSAIAIAMGVSVTACAQLKSEIFRPNIIMIVVDDMRFDEWGMGGHPFLETPVLDAMAARGAVFPKTYHAIPLCSPNRASLLTGQYASRHGIIDNSARNSASHKLDLFAKDLQKSGYRTAHIGKWHMGNDPTQRPGYDYWVCLPGQGKANDSPLYENGKVAIAKGHITDILTDRALGFINEAKAEQPFFCYIGHKAIHPDVKQLDTGGIDFATGSKFNPAKRHVDYYKGRVFPRAESFGPPRGHTKPVIQGLLEIKNSEDVKAQWETILDPQTSDETIEERAEMMLAVDEGLGRIVEALENKGLTENTIIFFTSDNGYFFGEHGLSIERRLPYQESIRAPLVVSGAGIKAGIRKNAFVSSIDIAPTILEFAKIKIPEHVQGVSFKNVLSGGTATMRQSVYVEYYSHEIPMPWTVNMDYRCLIHDKYKMIVWIHHDNVNELYNIEEDPNELDNLYNNSKYTKVRDKLKRELVDSIARSYGI